MSDYIPDNWVVLKISVPGQHTVYKVLAGWSGGYLDGDSWRMNSGVTEVTEDGDYLLFHGYSGSVYRCHKKSYGLRMGNASVYNKLKERFGDAVELMPEDIDWMNVKW